VAPGPFPTRTFGVLLHPSSLPGHDLIGTLGEDARRFVDWLAGTGAGIWQILPLTVNGKYDSPYFSSSAFAGNHWLIDLEALRDAGLLGHDEVRAALHDHALDARIPFDEMRLRKLPLLSQAADAFLSAGDHPWWDEFRQFVADADWLDDTCLFFALHDRFDGASWTEWPDALRRHRPDAVADARRDLADEVARWQAVLFFFEHQWRELLGYAHARGLRVFGDLPIYVSPESADVWAHQEQFQLDAEGGLVVQSGCPPDYFSEVGQMWRNPLYRWDVMAADGYSWWLRRLRRCLELTDIVRIDHFRALAAYWEIPGDAEDARSGRWVTGPGQDFLEAVRAEFPTFPFVAEDLGTLDDDVYRLRDDNGLPGMRIIQFGFDGTPDNPHLPHLFPESCIVYTGTHDNAPISEWWAELDPAMHELVGDYYQHGAHAPTGRAVWSFIEAAIGSRAVCAVVPMQDLLVLDGRSRMNDPSVEQGNWGWRMPPDACSDDLARSIRSLAARYARH
jgi:4-alpha-glucanotransferase